MSLSASKKSLALIAVLAIVLAGGIFVYMNFGGILTRTAERIASNALGVPVDIGSIRLSVSDRTAIVSSVDIGNPPGYTQKHAIEVNEVHIALNAASKELIDVKDVAVRGSVVNVEINENGINLKDLQNLANRKKQKESAGSEQIRVIVEKMAVEASTINVTSSFLGRHIDPITMPPVTISRIGSGNAGVSADEALARIIGKYLGAAQSEVSRQGLMQGLDKEGIIDEAKEKLKSLFE